MVTLPFPAFVFSPYVTLKSSNDVILLTVPTFTATSDGLIAVPLYSNVSPDMISVSPDMSYLAILNVYSFVPLYLPTPVMTSVAVPTS